MRKKIRLDQAQFSKQGENFSTVTLPHTWNKQDGQDGGNDYWRGLGTYQIELPVPTPGKRQYIEFGAANHVATVWCNGRELGTHKGGFSTFRYELTPSMTEQKNVLTVSVSNAKSNIYPQNADFTFFGGLYRQVTYIEVEPAHFDLLKHGTDAVFVTPRSTGTTRVDLFTVEAEGCTVTVDLQDADGKSVANGQCEAKPHTALLLHVSEPHLWNGVDEPYCYTALATLQRGDEILDQISVIYGYRSYRIDAENGFILNGKQYPLHGVARHQDRQDKGWAISQADQREDLELIRDMGANTIRLAHYQHDQYFYDLCDQAGVAVWSEVPFISEFNPSKEAHDNILSQMTELIAQCYNHPSIIVWGIANEITMIGGADTLFGNLTELHALAKTMDPSRLTVSAEFSTVPMDHPHVYITDAISYNNYYGWYSGDAADNGPWLDKFHSLNPDRPIGLSEYGADAVLKWHSADPENHDYTEEYAAQYHHEMLKTFASRPYLWATHVWNMFDFAADARNEGGMKGRNNKGLVTYDRKIKKEAYFIYQAYWTQKPMLHVCGERFVDRAPGERDITVYTNCPEATLVVNGQTIATLPVQDHACVFRNVELADGPNTIQARYGALMSNRITLNAVAEHNEDYDLPDEEGTAGNWFETQEDHIQLKPLTYPKGYYSIRDRIGDLRAHPQAAAIIQDVALAMMKQEMSTDEVSGDIITYYDDVRLSTLFRTMGKYLQKGTKQAINEKLTQIKKDIPVGGDEQKQ